MNKFNRYALIIVAFLAGVAAPLAFAPTYYLSILLISFPVLLLILNYSDSYKFSFLIGWVFGFGYFLSGLYWISYALLVRSVLFGWLVPFAITLIPAILAVYIGIITTITYRFRHNQLKLVMIFITLWILVEIVRSRLFTGFPWLSL